MNQLFVAIEIIIFNLVGLFGNINLLVLTFKKPSLHNKSSFLQCCLSFSHIICLLFELPNAFLLITGLKVSRSFCYPAISLYIFFICTQAMLMLMLVIDLYAIIFLPKIYRTMDNFQYVMLFLTPPLIYSSFVLIYGFLKIDDQLLLFCNPPLALHPTASRFWSLSNVVINTTVLALFMVIIVIFHYKGMNQKKNTRWLIKRPKVTVFIFLISWYTCILGVDFFVTIGLSGNSLAFLQSNMVFFALLCYSQSFYVILWRSSEYRLAFMELWACVPIFKSSKLRDKWAGSSKKRTTRVSTIVST
ncbi:unnamed protein product [Caenorhabditis bovis]|uniref:G-protein coupled receptors family 1 profile domain-containing protein n=1 Tax=Caenorhabditis bovis TaxID=2654633 RepID=A0A8S1EH91_9PELO|nr:unnamed protein product [Caenorhabditis bovis]